MLVAFEGTIPGKPITRTKAEAEALANELFKKAKAGADFDALVKEHTDDAHPGIYQMANFGLEGNMEPEETSEKVFQRGRMVGAFGNTGFPLDVGEIDMANYDPTTSKYGWHIIKRIK